MRLLKRRSRWAEILLQPRWLVLTFLVLVFVPLAIYLGSWQFDRDEQRGEINSRLAKQLSAQPIALPASDTLASIQEWTPISMQGRFDPNVDIVVRRRTQDGLNGFYILTPFEASDGRKILVNRGWLRATGAAANDLEVPAAPRGYQSIDTRWRPSEVASGPLARDLPDYQVMIINPAQIAENYPEVGLVLDQGYLQAEAALSERVETLQIVKIPSLSGGPHLGYALQWLIFGSIAIVGWVLLLRREVRQR